MKLKRNCIFFNARTNDGGRTPDWGHELGQSEKKGYLMSVEGCSKIINGLVYSQVKDINNFSYGNGGQNYSIEIISVFDKVSIKVYDSENNIHNTYEISKPFILIITKEISGEHLGRRTLKMNKNFSYNGNKNEDFFEEINKIVTNPWFAYSLEYDNIETGILTLTIIKAPKTELMHNNSKIVYATAKERKAIWDELANNYSAQYESSNDTIQSSFLPKTNKTHARNIIYFGSPGTGKSNIVDEVTKGCNVRKVTFHPEYDYNSFVGGYKPSMVGKDIVYKFVPQIFTNIYVEAWKNPEQHYYLQIEEINRGNCAEIFGDLFQLLDRDDDGSSKYDIDASEELVQYLTEEFSDENNGLKNGKIKLPNNLSIVATMNTSDQSLFPMDSAFKRRWDWEYMRIDYSCNQSDFILKFNNGNTYEWLQFLEAVNKLIFEVTDSPDKQIGNWFINATSTNKEIDEKTFVNKVLFYLWNDVFKDEDESLFNIDERTVTYEDFFTENGTNTELIIKIIEENLGLNNKTIVDISSETVELNSEESSTSE